MNPNEELISRIEAERIKLNSIIKTCTLEEAYDQSKKVDKLVEEYIDKTN